MIILPFAFVTETCAMDKAIGVLNENKPNKIHSDDTIRLEVFTDTHHTLIHKQKKMANDNPKIKYEYKDFITLLQNVQHSWLTHC